MKNNHTVARHLNLYLITNDPAIAEHAVGAGVDRIFVDLEIHGKRERQAGLDTPINAHTTRDIAAIRARLPRAYLLGRINPLHTGSQAEIDAVLAAGADAIMLPMFRRAAEVRQIAALVNGRAAFIPLVETKEAVACFEEWADAPNLTEIYVGLNDLRLSLGLPSIFSVLLNGMLEDFVRQISLRAIPFGFGGLGRLSTPQPVPAELLLAEHVRLGSTSVILSRAFHMRSKTLSDFTAAVDAASEVAAIRRAWMQLQSSAPQKLVRLNGELKDRIAQLDSGRTVPPA